MAPDIIQHKIAGGASRGLKDCIEPGGLVGVAAYARSGTGGGTRNGAALDTEGMHGVDALIFIGDVTGGTASTDGSVAVKFQEADENPASPGNPLASSWADIPAARVVGGDDDGATVTVEHDTPAGHRVIGLLPNGRFVRAVLTETAGTGNTDGVDVNVALLGSMLRVKPPV